MDLLDEIFADISAHPDDFANYVNYLAVCKSRGDSKSTERLKVKYFEHIERPIADKLEQLYWETLAFEAQNMRFDSYLLYVEHKRKPDKQFYRPRRRYLKPIVDEYQRVADGELDLLVVCLVKRAGKSQLGINFINMLSGKFPNKSSLMEGSGDALVKSFYSGCLEYLQDTAEYSFYDIFPESKLVQTNADVKTINLVKKSRFPTVMCRSIDSSQVGLSEATNLLYLDDCVEGYAEAKNRDLLEAKWQVISGDILGRRIEGTPIVMCGTRYSLYDPIGKMIEKAEEMRWRYKVVEIPALDPITDESNYAHIRDGKFVFTTEYFRNERKLLSEEQWASEFQQQPFEARGLMFPESKLNRYFKLPPEKDPDAIVAVCDTAERGSDSVAMPIAYIYGSDIFIEDVVFDNSLPEITKPQCAKKLIQHKVATALFESNNAGEYFARDVESLMNRGGWTASGLNAADGSRIHQYSEGYRVNTSIRLKRTISNKHTRIEMASDGVMKNFWFKDNSLIERGGQYWSFMRELTGYTRTGKVPHDDAPDAVALLENFTRELQFGKMQFFPRPF